GVAVSLEAPLEQDNERGLAARRRSQQKQQPASDLRAGRSCRKKIDTPRNRIVDPKQFARQQPATENALFILGPLRPQHVPDILMAGARGTLRIAAHDRVEEGPPGARPVGRLVLAREVDQAVQEMRLARRRFRFAVGVYVLGLISGRRGAGRRWLGGVRTTRRKQRGRAP